MPSKTHQLRDLARHLFAQFVWTLLARTPQNGGTYWELKRLRPVELLVLLIPFSLYAVAGVWLYLFFPRHLIPVAAPAFAVGALFPVTLAGTTLLLSHVIDWRHYHR